jgi:hypothetical protein
MASRCSITQNLFDRADLFLNLPLIFGAFCFLFRIIAEFTGDILELTLRFVKFSFRFVLCIGFHGSHPE